jgi:hypothetical protein
VIESGLSRLLLMMPTAWRRYMNLKSGFAAAWRLIVGPYTSSELLSDHQLCVLVRVCWRSGGCMVLGQGERGSDDTYTAQRCPIIVFIQLCCPLTGRL